LAAVSKPFERLSQPGDVQPLRHLFHRGGVQFPRPLGRLVERGGEEVFDHFSILAFEKGRIDLDPQYLAQPIDFDLDQTAPGGARRSLGLQMFVDFAQLPAQLLSLFHDRTKVR
jgi:hypothetical protein